MGRVEILYDLLLVVCANETTKVWFQPSGVLYNNFSKKGARNLGANSRNPGANSRNPGAILKSGGLLFYLL